MFKISKEKWDSIEADYKGIWQDYHNDHPEWLGKKVVMSTCITDNPNELGKLLVEGVHFCIVNEAQPDSNFKKLLISAKIAGYKKQIECGEWSFVPDEKQTGCFKILNKRRTVVSVENSQIVNVEWGAVYKDGDNPIFCREILEQVLEIPDVKLDVYQVETDDGLSALGFGDPVHLMSLDESMDMYYERAWYVSKPLEQNGLNDYVLFLDCGNSWCEIEHVFESMTEKIFYDELKKYLKNFREKNNENTEV